MTSGSSAGGAGSSDNKTELFAYVRRIAKCVDQLVTRTAEAKESPPSGLSRESDEEVHHGLAIFRLSQPDLRNGSVAQDQST